MAAQQSLSDDDDDDNYEKKEEEEEGEEGSLLAEFAHRFGGVHQLGIHLRPAFVRLAGQAARRNIFRYCCVAGMFVAAAEALDAARGSVPRQHD